MTVKRVYFRIIILILVSLAAIAVLAVVNQRQSEDAMRKIKTLVLGENSKVLPQLSLIASPIVSQEVRPTPESYTLSLVSIPKDLAEGDQATFTWLISGSAQTIHTTAVYYGMTSSPEEFTHTVAPENTSYSYTLKDFMDGQYQIPMQFIGNVKAGKPATYYVRAYALIDGKHYWSDERSFAVHELPKHEVKVINYSPEIRDGENASFTWEIAGPQASTGFTAIVGGKESKPGELDTSIDIPKTPYKIITKDFTDGTYTVPYRFIGNVKVEGAGVYYFRVLAFINGKNIWSPEYSFSVK